MTRNKLSGLVTIFLALIIFGGVVFLYQHRNSGSQELIDFVPPDSVTYIEFDLQKFFPAYFKENKFRQDKFHAWAAGADLPDSVWAEWPTIKTLGLVGIYFDDQLKKVWLAEFNDPAAKDKAVGSEAGFYYEDLGPAFLGISRSAPALKKISANQLFGAKNASLLFPPDDNIFLRAFVASELAQNSLANLLGGQLSAYFQLKEETVVSLRLKPGNGERIIFDLEVPLANPLKSVKRQPSASFFFKTGKTFQIGGLAGRDLLVYLKDNFENESGLTWDDLIVYVEDKYAVDFNLLNKFFEQPFLLVVRPFEAIDKLDFFDPGKNFSFAVVGEMSPDLDRAAFGSNLESFISRYLAFRFPSQRIKTLPDGSHGVELVADSGRIVFESLSGKKVGFRCAREAAASFCYALSEDKIYLSNSRPLLDNLLASDVYPVGFEDNGLGYEAAFDPNLFNDQLLQLGEFVFVTSALRDSLLHLNGMLIID